MESGSVLACLCKKCNQFMRSRRSLMLGCGGLASILKGSSIGDRSKGQSNGVMSSSCGEELIPHSLVGIKLCQSLVLSASSLLQSRLMRVQWLHSYTAFSWNQ